MNERGYIVTEVLLMVLLAAAMITLSGMYAFSDRALTASINRATASCLAQKELVCLKSKVLSGMRVPEELPPQVSNGVSFKLKEQIVPEEGCLYKIAVTVDWDEQGMKREFLLQTAVVANE